MCVPLPVPRYCSCEYRNTNLNLSIALPSPPCRLFVTLCPTHGARCTDSDPFPFASLFSSNILILAMYSASAHSGLQCEACDQIFILEANLTKHRKQCTAVRKHSQRLWRNGATNIKKLNASLKDSRKRLHEEVYKEVHEDYRVQELSPSVNNAYGVESVRILPVLYPGLDDTHLSSRM
jgi:hypothetical protein